MFNANMEVNNYKMNDNMPAMDMGKTQDCCAVDPCMMMGANECCMPMQPVYECPQERCCHRYITHDVQHIVPCHTRMINHHVYRHSYTPCYSYSEEDEYCNMMQPRC